MNNLKERFERCIRTLKGFESIDSIVPLGDRQGMKRADYLLWNRRVIVEQKVLENDPFEKIQAYFEKLQNEGTIIFFGTRSTDDLFRKIPDGQRHKRNLVLKLANAVDGAVSRADQQTKGTREIFQIPNATGILIIVNENARVLDPKIIHYGLSNAFQKRSADGAFLYPNNNGVILVSEHPSLGKLPGSRPPFVPFWAPQPGKRILVARVCDALSRAWKMLESSEIGSQ